MRKNRFRIILIIAAIALTLYYLYPTYQSGAYDKKLEQLSGTPKLNAYLKAHPLTSIPDSLRQEYFDSLQQVFSADSLRYYDANAKEINSVKLKRIKLGLDLQGGMHIVLQVNVVKMLEDMAKNKDQTFDDIMKQVASEVKNTNADALTALEQACASRNIRLST